jgi:hypothetical protein
MQRWGERHKADQTAGFFAVGASRLLDIYFVVGLFHHFSTV